MQSLVKEQQRSSNLEEQKALLEKTMQEKLAEMERVKSLMEERASETEERLQALRQQIDSQDQHDTQVSEQLANLEAAKQVCLHARLPSRMLPSPGGWRSTPHTRTTHARTHTHAHLLYVAQVPGGWPSKPCSIGARLGNTGQVLARQIVCIAHSSSHGISALSWTRGSSLHAKGSLLSMYQRKNPRPPAVRDRCLMRVAVVTSMLEAVRTVC